MFQLLRSISRQDLAARQAPAFLASFGVATFFYHFGNFALECAAFLVTWFVIDALAQLALTHRNRRTAAPATGPDT